MSWFRLSAHKTGGERRAVHSPGGKAHRLRLSAQIAEQVGEGGLEGVVVFPVREVGDVLFAEFDREIFACVGVEAVPDADAVEAHQPDGEQFLA